MPEIGMDFGIEKYTVQSFTKFNNIWHGNGQLLKNEQKKKKKEWTEGSHHQINASFWNIHKNGNSGF